MCLLEGDMLRGFSDEPSSVGIHIVECDGLCMGVGSMGAELELEGWVL